MARTVSGLALRISEIRFVRALNNGLMKAIPFILAGALCVAVFNLPIPAYQDFVRNAFFGQLAVIFDSISAATLSVVSIVVLIAISYNYSIDEPMVKNGTIHPLAPVITAFCCYIALFMSLEASGLIAISNPGRGGMFFSMLLALVVPWLFFAFLKLRMKIRPYRYSALDSNLLMRLSLRAIFPVTATIVTFVVFKVVVLESAPIEMLENAFLQFAQANLGKEDIFSVILTVLLMQLMWFVGIHGGGVVFDDIMNNATVHDVSSMFATQDFYFVFVNIGGAGALLGLLLALWLFKPGYREKHLANVSAVPLVFNINESLIFGIPIIFNPFYAIPFILGPALIAAIAYGAFASGIVPAMTLHVEWTTPIIFSGFLTTNSIAGVVLQLVCLGLAMLVYTPFVLGYRRSLIRHRKERVAAMQDAMTKAADTDGMSVIERDDIIGTTAREMSAYIHGCFELKVLPFYLVYQPKTDSQGKAVGAEALLRWKHPDYGVVSPIVLVELCDETGLSVELGRWITAEGMKEYKRWKERGIKDLRLSINLNPRHFEQDDGFVDFLAEQIRENNIKPGEIELEITEHMAMHFTPANEQAIKSIRELGIDLSIDDMGIGYSSLTYISDFGAKRIKVDVSLVSQIETDRQQREILRSIVNLAEQLDLGVVVEGVEQQGQVDALVDLGVKHFQGYYFSKPLEPKDFVEYVEQHCKGNV